MMEKVSTLGKLTSPSVIRGLLNSLGHRPNKGLGQNYLIDSNILGILLAAAQISDGDRLLEIGPGLGALTQVLLATGAPLIAIEKDPTMVSHLRKTFCASNDVSLCDLEKNPPRPSGTPPREGNSQRPHTSLSRKGGTKGGADSTDEPYSTTRVLQKLELLEADVLDVNLAELFEKGVNKVVANLPYSVGSRFIVNALEAAPLPEKMVFMIQKEVADRLTAQPGSKTYGPLAIWSQLNYEVKNIKTVSPNCFMPAPKVWSAVVRFKKRAAPLAAVADYARFKRLVKTVFTQRRKQIGSNLRKNLPDFFQGLEKAGIDPSTRPEQIPIEQWVALARR